ncbi:MAG: sigma-70 family RNA polymerase sigma factor [Acidimicrobiia bacterium]|nr:sigma-70 family RNA polymerase sigma factor [Acidimicrobiia bacterium]
MSERDDAQLVRAARQGDQSAFSTLFERWFDRSFDVAWRILRNNDDAAEVTQDVFLAVWKDLDSLRNPEAFGGWVLRSSRNRALNRLERERRSRATDPDDAIGAAERAPIGVAASTDARPGDDPADALVAAGHVALVWDAAEALGERDASILDLHLRHGLEPAEIADALEVTPNNAHQLLFRLRKKLTVAIRARVLWRDGDPHCDELARVLFDAGVTSFGARAVKVIERHAETCPVCSEERAAILSPEAMFAGVPVLAAPPALRRSVEEHLRREGVPVDVAVGTESTGEAAAVDTVAASGRSQATLAGVGGGLLAVVAVVVGIWLWQSTSGDDPTALLATESDPAVEEAAPPATETDAEVVDDEEVAAPPAPTAVDAIVGPKITLPQGVDAPPASDDPALVDPPAPPPTPAPTAPRPPTTTPPPNDPTTSTTRPVAAPTLSATARSQPPGAPCQSFERRVVLAWQSTGATEVTIAGPAAPGGPLPAEGSATVCVPPGDPDPASWTVTATGPGGSTSVTVSE